MHGGSRNSYVGRLPPLRALLVSPAKYCAARVTWKSTLTRLLLKRVTNAAICDRSHVADMGDAGTGVGMDVGQERVVQMQFSVEGWAFLGGISSNSSRSPGDTEVVEGISMVALPEGALDYIPSSLRRRCSPFSKRTLAVARAALGEAVAQHPPTVFASQHGEANVTYQLLDELARNEPLSPMGFSLSVHNAASGVFSIATGNRAPSTAIAAGQRTFLMGLQEAFLQLKPDEEQERVLYVCSDDLVPSAFLDGEQPGAPYALALLMGVARGAAPDSLSVQLHLEMDGGPQAGAQHNAEEVALPHAVRFAEWLNSGSLALDLSDGQGKRWCFSKQGSASLPCRGVA